MDKLVRKGIEKLERKYNLKVKGMYDPKSDDMTGSIYINGKKTMLPYPCDDYLLFDWLYWEYHRKM